MIKITRLNSAIFKYRTHINEISYYSWKSSLILPSSPQKREFSLKTSMESLARSQEGIFKTLSESTPVEYCQNFLLYVHECSGLPWWTSIILSTIIARSFVIPVAVYQQKVIAKLENIKLELPVIAKELKQEIAVAVRLYNWDEKTARLNFNRTMRKQYNELIIHNNCHPLKTTMLLWFQLPLWISLSVSIRNLVYMLPVTDAQALITFQELCLGGFLFIPNLTIPDASWILPVALGILNLAIIEIQVLSRNNDNLSTRKHKILTNVFRGFSLIMIPIGASVPSSLILYWTTSSAFGLLQNLALMSPNVKRLCRIPETQMEIKKPYKMIVNNFKTKIKLN